MFIQQTNCAQSVLIVYVIVETIHQTISNKFHLVTIIVCLPWMLDETRRKIIISYWLQEFAIYCQNIMLKTKYSTNNRTFVQTVTNFSDKYTPQGMVFSNVKKD